MGAPLLAFGFGGLPDSGTTRLYTASNSSTRLSYVSRTLETGCGSAFGGFSSFLAPGTLSGSVFSDPPAAGPGKSGWSLAPEFADGRGAASSRALVIFSTSISSSGASRASDCGPSSARPSSFHALEPLLGSVFSEASKPADGLASPEALLIFSTSASSLVVS